MAKIHTGLPVGTQWEELQMNLSIRIADPAGNITIFVMSHILPGQYAPVAAQLLAHQEYHAEQVAFRVLPRLGGDGRIQMMGGEFCGNAARSYGYLLSTMLPGEPSLVKVEISGADQPLEVKVDRENGRCQIEMPLPIGTEVIPYHGVQYEAVCFDGIVHTIVPGPARDEAFVKGVLAAAKAAVPSSAYGILFAEGDHMVPVVYVCETDSLIWESSCGSGSMAVGVLRAIEQDNGEFRCSLHQPGGIIEVTATVENGKVVRCSMGGPVTLSDEITLELPEC